MATTGYKTALAALKTQLDTLVGVAVGDANQIRAVFWGQGFPSESMVPFLALQVIDFRDVGPVQGEDMHLFTVKLRVYFEVSGYESAMDDCVDYAGSIEEKLKAWLPQTGVDGGEGILWSPTIPRTASHGVPAIIEGEAKLVIRTTRSSVN